ncbi:MAG: NigD-like C-terminal domain-containing protein [Bacteroidota bacterium]|nr:NigD-like C-terminal domain-containing protein [Bacteroidota bacterium]
MKTTILYSVFFIAIMGVFSSCLKNEDNEPLYYATGTVTQGSDSKYYIADDDGPKLWSSSQSQLQSILNKRVLVRFYNSKDALPTGYDEAIQLLSIDTILTKNVILLKPSNADSIGNDPIRIDKSYVADKYLTVWFTFVGGGVKHFINLVRDTSDKSSPVVLEFRHNAKSDMAQYYLQSLVSFNLESLKKFGFKDSVSFVVKSTSTNGSCLTSTFKYKFK